jgi:hypothetical protein
LPEKRHLSDVESSHYSSLFVIRFPIAKENEKQIAPETKKASLCNTRIAIINHMKKTTTTTKTGTLDRFDQLEKKRKKKDEIHLPLGLEFILFD